MADRPVQRVLMIRPSALGDVARTVPALVSLRQAYPDAAIDWLVQDNFIDVVKHHPMLTRAIPFPRQGGVGAFRSLARKLKAANYDLVVDLQGLARSGLLTWLTRAPRRVGYRNARELGWLGCNQRVPVDATMHAVDRMLALVEAATQQPPSHDMQLYAGEVDRAWMQRTVGDEPFAVLAPTARWRCKCWPIERYIELARRLLDEQSGSSRLVVLASPGERAQVQPLLDAFTGERRVVQPATDTVGRMMAVLERASLVVCNDSAPLHIAVGFHRPLAAIFGPTDPALVGPYLRENTVIQPPDSGPISPRLYRQLKDDQSLIARVDLEAVWRVVERECAQGA